MKEGQLLINNAWKRFVLFQISTFIKVNVWSDYHAKYCCLTTGSKPIAKPITKPPYSSHTQSNSQTLKTKYSSTYNSNTKTTKICSQQGLLGKLSWNWVLFSCSLKTITLMLTIFVLNASKYCLALSGHLLDCCYIMLVPSKTTEILHCSLPEHNYKNTKLSNLKTYNFLWLLAKCFVGSVQVYANCYHSFVAFFEKSAVCCLLHWNMLKWSKNLVYTLCNL